MSRKHVVGPRETLWDIARLHGFSRLDTIWNHSENQALRERRRAPDWLVEGDVVTLPKHTPAAFSRATGQEHPLTLHIPALKLRVRLLQIDDTPIANEPVELELHDRTTICHTDADGILEASLTQSTGSAVLRFADQEVHLDVGALAPIDTLHGRDDRLINLGHVDASLRDDDERGEGFVLEHFQARRGLPITGVLDAETSRALEAAHDTLTT